jgi:hypothetical protein
MRKYKSRGKLRREGPVGKGAEEYLPGGFEGLGLEKNSDFLFQVRRFLFA